MNVYDMSKILTTSNMLNVLWHQDPGALQKLHLMGLVRAHVPALPNVAAH